MNCRGPGSPSHLAPFAGLPMECARGITSRRRETDGAPLACVDGSRSPGLVTGLSGPRYPRGCRVRFITRLTPTVCRTAS